MGTYTGIPQRRVNTSYLIISFLLLHAYAKKQQWNRNEVTTVEQRLQTETPSLAQVGGHLVCQAAPANLITTYPFPPATKTHQLSLSVVSMETLCPWKPSVVGLHNVRLRTFVRYKVENFKISVDKSSLVPSLHSCLFSFALTFLNNNWEWRLGMRPDMSIKQKKKSYCTCGDDFEGGCYSPAVCQTKRPNFLKKVILHHIWLYRSHTSVKPVLGILIRKNVYIFRLERNSGVEMCTVALSGHSPHTVQVCKYPPKYFWFSNLCVSTCRLNCLAASNYPMECTNSLCFSS